MTAIAIEDEPHNASQSAVGRRCLLLLAAWIFAAPVALAADLQVNPIMLEFNAGEQAQALSLTNSGTAPLRAQVRVASWTQRDGQDQLTPTRDLVASPAIVEIAAGEEQLVRLIRPRTDPLQSELAYRLTIDELPVDDAQPADSGVRFLLRYSVPVFVLAEGTEPLSPSRRSANTPAETGDATGLGIRLESQGDASLLEVSNPGRQRVRLSNVAWSGADAQRTELVPGLLGYVLAGQQMRWTIPLPPTLRTNGGTLKARLNDNPSDQTLPLDPAGG